MATGYKSTIAEMRSIAEKRGGKCLSEVYVNNKARLVWQCVNGHIWEARPVNVKSGRWCPACAKASVRAWNNSF